MMAKKQAAEMEDAQLNQERVLFAGTQILTGRGQIFNHVDAGLPMWSADGDRLVELPVTFISPFRAAPAIMLGLIGIDSAHDQNLRFWLSARDVSPKGVVIEFSTWADTHIARAAISWQAIGPV